MVGQQSADAQAEKKAVPTDPGGNEKKKGDKPNKNPFEVVGDGEESRKTKKSKAKAKEKAEPRISDDDPSSSSPSEKDDEEESEIMEDGAVSGERNTEGDMPKPVAK